MRLVRTLSVVALVLLAGSTGVTNAAAGPGSGSTWPSGIEGDDLAIDVAVTSDTIYVLETVYPSDIAVGSLVLRAYDPGGSLRWSIPVAGSETYSVLSDAAGLAADDDGPAVAAFQHDDVVVHRYDPLGAELWQHPIEAGAFSLPLDLAMGDGLIAVAGLTRGSLVPGRTGGAFVRVFDPDGGIRWTRQWGAIPSLADAVAIGDGIVAVASRSPRDDRMAAFVSTFDAAGRPMWHRRIAIPGYLSPTGVVTSAGRVWVSGGSFGPEVTRGFIAGFDAAGDRTWIADAPDGSYLRDLALVGAELVAVGQSTRYRQDRWRFSGLVARVDIAGGHLSTTTFGGRRQTQALAIDYDEGSGVVAISGVFELDATPPEQEGFVRARV